MPKLTAVTGNSNQIFPDLLDLYARPGFVIADITYGRGVFWRNVDISQYNLIASDLIPTSPGIVCADARVLPHLGNASIDLVVFDPPFMAGVKVRGRLNAQYQVNALNQRYAGVLTLYRETLCAIYRVLRPNAYAIIKCQDIVESGKRHFAHVEILELARAQGFLPIDLAVLVMKHVPMMRHKTQVHLRANHSYFWVLQKEKIVQQRS